MRGIAEQIIGLSSAEVQDRLQRGERNRAAMRPTRTYWQIIWANAFSLYNVVLFASFAALFAIRGPGSAIFPAAIVLINVVLGLVQEIRAKRALDRLAALSVHTATVRRDGENRSIPVEDVVRDDVIELHPGDAVVVDGSVVASEALEIDESQLSGESEYVSKQTGDQLTSGSFCVAGAGLMRAEGIGKASYVNHLADVARAYKNIRSPLEHSLDALVKLLLPLMILLAPLTLLSGHLRGAPLGDSLENVVNLMSSLVPQGLIVFVSISFAFGVIRITRFNALVQRPNAIELMGHIRFLCADKTGTLTRNVLKVKDVSPFDGTSRQDLDQKLGLYLSNVSWQNRTVEAIASYSATAALPPTKIAETPFSSDRKWSSVTLSTGESLLLGAPEVLLEQPRLRAQALQMEQRGLRVLAFASSPDRPAADGSELPPQLRELALIALEDELRPSVAETLHRFADQDIAVKIISGDSAETLRAVAQATGLAGATLLSEADLEALDAPAFETAALSSDLFARITPRTKRRIVAALAAHGPVAMIGDGVNDVPALKQASLAIAMNDGAQIAKDVSDVTLLDNDFTTLPRALFEGRELAQRLYGIARINLIKVFYLTLLFVLVGYVGLHWPADLLQTTWLSLITLTLPAMLIIFRILPIPRSENRLGEVVEYIVRWGTVAAVAMVFVDIVVLVTWEESLAVARTVMIAFAGLYNSLVLWDIYGINPFSPRSFLSHRGPALAGGVFGLVSALVPSYAIPQLLGLAPMPARVLVLLAGALLVSYLLVFYLGTRRPAAPGRAAPESSTNLR